MSCSCRAAPWRTFLRGLAQVHKLDGPSSVASLNLRTGPILRPATFGGQRMSMLRQNRGLHGSGYRRQEATAVVEESGETKPADATAVGEATEKKTATKTTEKKASKKTAEKKAPKTTAKKTTPRKTPTETAEKETASEQQKPADQEEPKAEPRNRTVETPEFLQEAPKEVTWRSTPSTGNNETPRRPRKTEQPKAAPVDTYKPKDPTPKPMTPKESWQLQKATLKEKFPGGWKPRKRLSPDALAGIRALNAQFPDVYTTEALADKFEVAPEAIRRILKGKWQPSVDEEQSRQDRWFRRGQQVWEQQAALGMKPPKRWRDEGIKRDPGYHAWSKKASRREQDWEDEEIRKYREHRARQKNGTSGNGQ